MIRRNVFAFALTLLVECAPADAQWLNYPTPGIPRTPDGKPNLSAPSPRTLDGKPDLSGIWTITKKEGGLSQLKPSEIKPWALKLAKQRGETLFKDGPATTCQPNAEPGLTKIVRLVLDYDRLAELDESGLTMREIGAELGVSAAFVCRALKARQRLPQPVFGD